MNIGNSRGIGERSTQLYNRTSEKQSELPLASEERDIVISLVYNRLFKQRSFAICPWYEESIYKLIVKLNGERLVFLDIDEEFSVAIRLLREKMELVNLVLAGAPLTDEQKIAKQENISVASQKIREAMKRLSDRNLRLLSEQTAIIIDSSGSEKVVRGLFKYFQKGISNHPRGDCSCRISKKKYRRK